MVGSAAAGLAAAATAPAITASPNALRRNSRRCMAGVPPLVFSGALSLPDWQKFLIGMRRSKESCEARPTHAAESSAVQNKNPGKLAEVLVLL
jgi:hypothetical protein